MVHGHSLVPSIDRSIPFLFSLFIFIHFLYISTLCIYPLSVYMFYAMRTLAFFAILPLVLSLQLLHFPTPQDTLDLAESLIYSGRAHVGGYAVEADMGHANDMRLSAIGDEHVVLSHKKYPVGRGLLEDGQGTS